MVFETLHKRTIFEGEIETLTPLHVGSGRPELGEERGVDLPVLRDVKDVPYVPGSSLKGKIRAEAERIARTLGYTICTPPDVADMCGSKATREEDLCIMCKIFGTASVKGGISRASKVKFRDAYPSSSIEAMITRTGIALDRETGSVRPGALYTVEGVPKGTVFELEIVAENLTDEEKKLLKAALKSVEDSSLGGQSTRGFGKVKFVINQARIRTAKYYVGEEDEVVIKGEELWK